MILDANSKAAEAAVAFQCLTAAYQDAIIETIKHLLSEREKSPVQQETTAKTTV